jgi:hypothetical protein
MPVHNLQPLPSDKDVVWTVCPRWLNDMDQETPIMLNGMADAGSLLCMHDSSVSTCENIGRLVNLLVTAEPQTTANPQVW